MFTHLMNNNKIQEYNLVIELDNRQLLNLSLNKFVTLSPSECLILKHLMGNCSQTIGREFLLTHCWPGRVVTSSSLNVAIKNVRTALKEVGSDCKVITVQKEGYCFVAPEKDEVQPAIESEPVEVTEISSPKRRSLFPLVQFKAQLVPLGAGIGVSVLLVVVLSYFGLFMERTSINGIDVYHDSVEFDSMLMEDLASLSEPGVEAIYLHRTGVDCGSVQVVVLNQTGWQDVSSGFESQRCVEGLQESKELQGSEKKQGLENTEGTVDEA